MSDRIHLDLEITLDSEPIAGWLAPVGEMQVAFTGYTGLIAALEGVRDGEPDKAAPEHDPGSTPGGSRSGRKKATGGSQQ